MQVYQFLMLWCGNVSGCSVVSAMGNLDSYDINNLLNAGVTTDDIINCGNASGVHLLLLWVL